MLRMRPPGVDTGTAGEEEKEGIRKYTGYQLQKKNIHTHFSQRQSPTCVVFQRHLCAPCPALHILLASSWKQLRSYHSDPKSKVHVPIATQSGAIEVQHTASHKIDETLDLSGLVSSCFPVRYFLCTTTCLMSRSDRYTSAAPFRSYRIAPNLVFCTRRPFVSFVEQAGPLPYRRLDWTKALTRITFQVAVPGQQ